MDLAKSVVTTAKSAVLVIPHFCPIFGTLLWHTSIDK